MHTPVPIVLSLPGWLGSGPQHWQTRWQDLHGDICVQQHDWQRPLRGDWVARLQDVVLAQPADTPLILVAHSLGCILTAWWAAHSSHAARVHGALLVAPPDIEREDNRQKIPGWTPVVRQRLPFASVLVASQNDPFSSFDASRQLASDWGSQLVDLGNRGHVNADSGLGDWPEGRALMSSFETIKTIA